MLVRVLEAAVCRVSVNDYRRVLSQTHQVQVERRISQVGRHGP